MTDNPQDLEVENASLRGNLFITTRVLKEYVESPKTTHVPPGLRKRAESAIDWSLKILKNNERSR